jgi:hypothetical protein
MLHLAYYPGLVCLLMSQLMGAAAAQNNVYPYIKGNKFSNFPAPDAQSAPDMPKNQCVNDSFTGTGVCKAVDAAEVKTLNPSLSVIRPSYMRWANDNADGSRYFLYVNGEIPVNTGKGQLRIYNSADNSFYDSPAAWNSHENNEERWDDKDPNVLYHNLGCKFYAYDISSRRDTLIRDFARDFSGCSSIANGVEGAASTGSRYWTWMINGAYSHGVSYLLAVIVYDKQNDRIVGTLDRPAFVAQGGNADAWDSGLKPNMVDIAPSGDRVLLLWPALKYPAPAPVPVSGGGDKVVVSAGQATVQHGQVNRAWAPGDALYLSGCSGAAGGLNGVYTIASKPSDYSTVLDVQASGIPDGKYTCGSIQPAVVSITVASGIATALTGFDHMFLPGDGFSISGAPVAALNGSFQATVVPNSRSFTFPTKAPDGGYTASAGKGMVITWKWGEKIPDGDFRIPGLKPNNNVASDGPHAYRLDFTAPVKVCNDETHSGWAWAPNGDPVYICQISDRNWAKADPDSIGFTNLYTGVYTPVFYHEDLNYQGGWHFGRIYDRNIRGWGAAVQQREAGDNNALMDTLFFFELKKWDQKPRIWRAASTRNTHYNYDTEAHGNLTRDGLKFIWGANWNGPSGSPVNTYTAALPPNWWANLSGPALAVSPSRLEYACPSGSGPVSQELSLGMTAGSLGDWTVHTDTPWLHISTESGSGAGLVSVTVDCPALGTGSHHASIAVNASAPGGTQAIPILVAPGGSSFQPPRRK